MLLPHRTVVATKDQIAGNLGDEVAILHLGSGVYYGLNRVGARLWSLLQEPVAVQRLQEALLAEFDVDPDRLERDLTHLLDQLAAEGLIRVLEEPGP